MVQTHQHKIEKTMLLHHFPSKRFGAQQLHTDVDNSVGNCLSVQEVQQSHRYTAVVLDERPCEGNLQNNLHVVVHGH